MTPSPQPLRFDPLLLVHKAVRQVMFEAATQIGAVDPSDIFAVDRCARQVGRLLDLLPEAAPTLTPWVDALYQHDTAARHVAVDGLYREVTALVTRQLHHQQRDEAVSTAELHARHSDDELRAMRREQLAAMTERELADALGPLGAALSPQELGAFLDDVQASVDVQAFACLTDSLRRRLDPARWARVLRERGCEDAVDALQAGRGMLARSRRGDSTEPALHRRSPRADRTRLLTQ